jgi:hypothetical protein
MRSLTASIQAEASTIFKLSMLLDISDGKPGMLVPVFSSPSTNMPYVQQMDEFLMIKDMLPYLDYEHYRIAQPTSEPVATVGDKGIIAFRTPDDTLVSGDFEEI